MFSDLPIMKPKEALLIQISLISFIPILFMIVIKKNKKNTITTIPNTLENYLKSQSKKILEPSLMKMLMKDVKWILKEFNFKQIYSLIKSFIFNKKEVHHIF